MGLAAVGGGQGKGERAVGRGVGHGVGMDLFGRTFLVSTTILFWLNVRSPHVMGALM